MTKNNSFASNYSYKSIWNDDRIEILKYWLNFEYDYNNKNNSNVIVSNETKRTMDLLLIEIQFWVNDFNNDDFVVKGIKDELK